MTTDAVVSKVALSLAPEIPRYCGHCHPGNDTTPAYFELLVICVLAVLAFRGEPPPISC